MSRLEAVVERIMALPEDEQEAVIEEIESILREPASALTRAQWEAVDVELAASGDGTNLTHAAVMARMRGRFGR